MQGFSVLSDVVQIVWEKYGENLDFVENSNFSKEDTEGAVCGCSGINLQKNTHRGILLE